MVGLNICASADCGAILANRKTAATPLQIAGKNRLCPVLLLRFRTIVSLFMLLTYGGFTRARNAKSRAITHIAARLPIEIKHAGAAAPKSE